MIHYILLSIAGIFSGVLGGMGMGGGTLLIPLLTLFFGFNQRLAQGINLISFSVMAIFVLIIHIKNKLVDVKVAIGFFLLALVTTILGAVLANIIKAHYLRILYGSLLIIIAIFEAVMEIKRVFGKTKTWTNVHMDNN